MAYVRLGVRPLDYEPCRYEDSRLLFRGPKRALAGDYVTCLGGTDTYGKFISAPYPALLERATGLKCVNLGWPNAGVDVYLRDQGVLEIARRSVLVVLQVPCLQNMSNRFFTVHPRRNDRFLKARAPLRRLYPGVDFTEFHFTRHLLGHLQGVSPDRFAQMRGALQELWVARMTDLMQRIEKPVVLFWFSARGPGQADSSADVAFDPAFVTQAMVDAIRPNAGRFVEVVASQYAVEMGTRGMRFDEVEAAAAQELLGPAAHEEAAAALTPIVGHLAPE